MNQYNIRVTNTTKIALTLIFVPLGVMSVFVYGALKLPALPDWVVIMAISMMIILAMLLTFYVLKKITPVGTLALHDDGFEVTFTKKGILTPAPFTIKISDVINFAAEGSEGLYYLAFSTNQRPYKFNIEARSKSEEDLASFTELMGKVAQMVVNNNEQVANTTSTSVTNTSATSSATTPHTITSVTIYERWWAKVISVFAILIFVLMLGMLMFAPDKAPDWWRLIPLVAFGAPFIYKVWYHNYSKNKKQ